MLSLTFTQLSLELTIKSLGLMLPLPLTSKLTTNSLTTLTIGETESVTVMLVNEIFMLPDASEAIETNTFSPKSAQV